MANFLLLVGFALSCKGIFQGRRTTLYLQTMANIRKNSPGISPQ